MATERGTIFRIPLSDAESVGDNSYIHFLSPEEKASRLAGIELEIPEVKGLELNFDLDITNAAEVEVVVDQTSGSSLRGRGAGNMLIEINTNGKFNMWGDFVVYEGVYNFKYAGLVQKVFKVQSGGSINWNGSPVQAELDVSAIYEIDANPAILLETHTFCIIIGTRPYNCPYSCVHTRGVSPGCHYSNSLYSFYHLKVLLNQKYKVYYNKVANRDKLTVI